MNSIGSQVTWKTISKWFISNKIALTFKMYTVGSLNVQCWVPCCFLLFINDVSNFTTEGCVLNMYADDVIIYTSAPTSDELQKKLQLYIDNVHHWYHMNRLTINKKKSAVMVIGSKAQLQSLNLDQFSINLDNNQIELVNKAKYLGLLINDDLSWDDHILQLCKSMNYYVHALRRLNKIFPKQLLIKVYKAYIQSKLDYGLSIWGCTTEGNLDRVQRIQNFCARIICKNYDYINTRGIDIFLIIGDTDHSPTQRLISKYFNV